MDEKSLKLTSHNSRINLSHTLAKTKSKQPMSILTILNKQQPKLNNYRSVLVDYDSRKSQVTI